MGLNVTFGIVGVAVWGVATGMLMLSVVSKSIDGATWNLPSASFTAMMMILHISRSFSNLISVFVGWIFTAIVDGLTSRCRKNWGASSGVIIRSYACRTARRKYGWFMYRPLTKKY